MKVLALHQFHCEIFLDAAEFNFSKSLTPS
jgi:hypothetical protein